MQPADQRQQALYTALQAARQSGDLRQEAATLASIAALHMAQGERETALSALESARLICEALEDAAGEAQVLNNIGVIYQEQADLHRAQTFLSLALNLWRQQGDRVSVATTAFNLATVSYQLGDLEEAVQQLEEAHAIHVALGHPEAINELAALEQVRGELLLRRAREDGSGDAR